MKDYAVFMDSDLRVAHRTPPEYHTMVTRHGIDTEDFDNPLTPEEKRAWCQEWVDEGIADDMPEGLFVVLERDVSEWRKV